LMHQLLHNETEKTFFLNFDTPKLYHFEIEDFALLDVILSAMQPRVLFFDEIQIIEGWELYVRQKLDEGYRVVVTGSNASLLSKELGTKLTGRHITKELFPFSYHEFCVFTHVNPCEQTLRNYINIGGFPEYIKTKNPDIHVAMFDDILYRDIAVRHNIKDIKSLKRLVTFLATNVANMVTATKLTQIIGIKSAATVLEYFSFFELSYLIQLMPRFSYSHKVQLVNPRKIYFIDTGLLEAITVSSTEDNGRKLENIVFWELRRQGKEMFYYNEHGKECDFVVCKNNIPQQVLQVCYNLNHDNEQREINGLIDAMNFFSFSEGIIVTYNQSDTILIDNKRIDVVPFYEFVYR